MPKAGTSSFVYYFEHDHRDIMVNFDNSSKRDIRNYLKVPPLPSFVAALNSWREHFYPHISPSDCPWELHSQVAQEFWSSLREKIEEIVQDQHDKVIDNRFQDLDFYYESVRDNKHQAKFGERPPADLKEQYKNLASLEHILDKRVRASLNARFTHVLNKNHVQLNRWSLAWYWKTLFAAMSEVWDHPALDMESEVTIRISQVRQWVLVVVYTESLYTEPLNNDRDQLKVRRNLLRPPLFGLSERLIAWDQYFSLLRFQDRIAKSWENVSRILEEQDQDRPRDAREALRLHEEQGYVLGRHDISYTLRFKDVKPRRAANKIKATIAFDIDLHPYDAENWEVAVRASNLDLPDAPKITEENATNRFKSADSRSALLIRYPHDCVSIPVFQRSAGQKNSGDDGSVPRSSRNSEGIPPTRVNNDDDATAVESSAAAPEEKNLSEQKILLASDNVCRAYEMVSEIWNDRTARSVLVVAPPGSGKEMLTSSIHEFQDFKGPYVTYALSPSSHERNDQVLFGRDLRTVFEPGWDELLARATTNGKSISDSIDETHARLLKIFVETVIWVEGGKEPTWTQKGKLASKNQRPNDVSDPDGFISDGLLFKARKGVLFLDEIDKVPEQTRASLLRLLENDEFALYGTPMVIKLDKWRPLYIFAGSMPKEEVFQLKPFDFWTRISHVIEMQHPLHVDDAEERLRIARDYFSFFWVTHVPKFFKMAGVLPFKYEENTQQFFRTYYLGLFELMNDTDVVDGVATIFSVEIEIGDGSREFSVRNIRSVVARVVYGLIEYFLYDKRHDSTISEIRRAVAEQNRSGVRTPWFELLSMLLTHSVPISKVSKNTGKDGSGDQEIGGTNDGDIEKRYGEQFRADVRQIVRAAIRKIYI